MRRNKQNWGQAPWNVEFRPSAQSLPEPFDSAQGKHVDVAIVGGGFAGLTAAAYVKRLGPKGKKKPKKLVLLLEAGRVGNGASGRTGGMALAQSAAGDLPGLGDVLGGYRKILRELGGRSFIKGAELDLRGAWEIARGTKSMEGKTISPMRNSPIDWNDSGRVRAVKRVPGGTVNPGKVVTGLARAATRAGVRIVENARVVSLQFGEPVYLQIEVLHGGRTSRKTITADRVLLATNAGAIHAGKASETVTQTAQRPEHREHREERRAASRRLNYEVLGSAAGSGSGHYKALAGPKLTFALATAPLTKKQITALGMQSGRPFYTVDMPYLWGRLFRAKSPRGQKSRNGGMIFGSGLVPGWGETLPRRDQKKLWSGLERADVRRGESALRLKTLEQRVRALHPALKNVRVTHRWGGPILITPDFVPVFRAHPKSKNVIVLGGFSGHGVAQSVYLGRWAAEVLLGKRELPKWNKK